MSSKLFLICLSSILFAKVILQTEDYEDEDKKEMSNDDEEVFESSTKKTIKNPFNHEITVNNYMMETRLANDLVANKYLNIRVPTFNFTRKRSNQSFI